MAIKRKLTVFLASAIVALLPLIVVAQDPPAPGPDGGGGEPVDVPFDQSMNLLFLVAGVLFAAYLVYRKYSIQRAKA